MKKTIAALIITTAPAVANAIDSFIPLTAPATSLNTNENTNPFLLPAGWMATKVTDRNTLSLQAGFQSTFGSWDMMSVGGFNNEFIYIPMEVPSGAGVVRYDRDTGLSTTLLGGDTTLGFSSTPDSWDPLNDNFGAIDPAVITPTNTLVVAEEWTGNGRMFEISNQETATGPADTNVTWLSNIPSVSHEGVKFDSLGRMYFIDENASGSLYRMTPTVSGDLTLGKVEVMSVDSFTGNAAAGGTGQAGRTGAGEWVEIVDAGGNALTTADPFDFTSRGGRAAADEVGATPFGRPEDLEIATLANGNEAIFMATTDENIVWSVELDADGNEGVNVTEFVNSLTTPSSQSSPVGAGASDAVYGMDDVDNLAFEIGPNGELQLFVVEDENPSDIWVATDADGDGVADIIDLFASLGVSSSEATGFIVDPRGGYLVNIQHPSSANDALWSITQVAAVPVPAAAWLFGSGLLALLGISRRKQAA
ncbi:MAG: PhoX family protein [Gammaproteobacteria bacterium]|jgi:hypothetical protein|nr:PhoX family protein [Gammaproteobacteria bacterium]